MFDIKPDSDVYWCAADIGWVTGHSYIVYGPLANRTTGVVPVGHGRKLTPRLFQAELVQQIDESVFPFSQHAEVDTGGLRHHVLPHAGRCRAP